jgi:hypothetical protein
MSGISIKKIVNVEGKLPLRQCHSTFTAWSTVLHLSDEAFYSNLVPFSSSKHLLLSLSTVGDFFVHVEAFL